MRNGDEVERAFRRERWKALVFDVRRSWGTLLAVAAGIALLVVWVASPRRAVGFERGYAAGLQYVEKEDGPPTQWLYVRLDSGGEARVRLPRSVLYRERMRVEVRAIEREWWPRHRTYELTRVYDDDEAQSSP